MAIKSRFPSVLAYTGGLEEVLSFGVTETKSSSNTGTTDMTIREEQGERPKFGPHPKFDTTNFDFKEELDGLPFPVNIGEVELSLSQQKRFLELVYDHQSVSHYVMRI